MPQKKACDPGELPAPQPVGDCHRHQQETDALEDLQRRAHNAGILRRLINDASKRAFLILGKLLVHHARPVKAVIARAFMGPQSSSTIWNDYHIHSRAKTRGEIFIPAFLLRPRGPIAGFLYQQ